jgi:hypothetical protein
MAQASDTTYETHKSEENANVSLNTKKSSVKPPKPEYRDLFPQATKLSREENKSKKRKRGQPEPSIESNGLRNEELGAVNPERLEDGKRKKPKKPKKSTHVEPQEEEQVDPDEGVRMKKYEAIFSKYQMSAQLAEAEKKSAPPSAEQEGFAPPAMTAELHGKFRILELRKM